MLTTTTNKLNNKSTKYHVIDFLVRNEEKELVIDEWLISKVLFKKDPI